MGVWIEIAIYKNKFVRHIVTPFVGVWIEIKQKSRNFYNFATVTPFVGVWIEM